MLERYGQVCRKQLRSIDTNKLWLDDYVILRQRFFEFVVRARRFDMRNSLKLGITSACISFKKPFVIAICDNGQWNKSNLFVDVICARMNGMVKIIEKIKHLTKNYDSVIFHSLLFIAISCIIHNVRGIKIPFFPIGTNKNRSLMLSNALYRSIF